MSIYAKARNLIDRHRASVAKATLALISAIVIVGWEVDPIKKLVIDSGLLLVILLSFIVDISVMLSRLVSLRYKVSVCRNEGQNSASLKPFLLERPPRRADLLEYSAHSVHQLIEDLIRQGATLRVLIKHPETVGPFQRSRILASMAHLERFVLKGHESRVEIRCYKAPASLRGRKFDSSMVNVGWYLPDFSLEGQEEDMEVMGHCNPMIICSTATDEGQHLREMFDQIFESLWESAKDNDVRTVSRLHAK